VSSEQGLPFGLQAQDDGQAWLTLKAAATGIRPPRVRSTRFHFWRMAKRCSLSRRIAFSKTSGFAYDCPGGDWVVDVFEGARMPSGLARWNSSTGRASLCPCQQFGAGFEADRANVHGAMRPWQAHPYSCLVRIQHGPFWSDQHGPKIQMAHINNGNLGGRGLFSPVLRFYPCLPLRLVSFHDRLYDDQGMLRFSGRDTLPAWITPNLFRAHSRRLLPQGYPLTKTPRESPIRHQLSAGVG